MNGKERAEFSFYQWAHSATLVNGSEIGPMSADRVSTKVRRIKQLFGNRIESHKTIGI